MKFKPSQLIIIGILGILTVVLYLLPKKVLKITKEGANRDQAVKEAPVQPQTKGVETKSIESILTESLSALTEKEKNEVALNENPNQEELKKVLKAYKKLDNKLGIAICEEKLGEPERVVGMAYFDAYNQSKIEENKKAIALKALPFLKSNNEKNPDDITVKCALAVCYVETSPAPMKGIGLLREVLAKDSTNEMALSLIAGFDVKSGQIDKAISHYEMLIRHYPNDIKYSLYLAQLFSDRGETDKALETLTHAKKNARRKSALDSINTSIDHLK